VAQDDDAPDFAILLAAAYRAMTVRLRDELAAAGLGEMRSSYGFVIRAVDAEQPTVQGLADLLDVTKQTASKLADDMERAGYLERRPDPDDRRRVRLHLTQRGRAVRKRALRTSQALERELAKALGDDALAATRAALLDIVERHGGLEDVLAKRAKAPY
jgi:DNA-binding MarR family transcriptional regulator